MKYIEFTNLLTALKLCLAMIVVNGCEDKSEQSISNDVRLLTAELNEEDVKNQLIMIENDGLILELVFSHSLNTTTFENAFSVSGDAGYSFEYDETNSFVTISFNNIAFETNYTIQINSGQLGSNGEILPEPIELIFTTDPYVFPKVTIATENSSLLEGETGFLSVSLDKPALDDVTVELKFDGTAIFDTDYTIPTNIKIPAGELMGTLELKVLNDAETEGEEVIIVTITSISHAEQNEVQELVIILNDELPDLELKGVMALRWDGESDGNSGKAIHLIALKDIEDLSQFGIGVANNGGGTDGLEYNFPAISVQAGESILLSREPGAIETYFNSCYGNFNHIIQSDAMSQNGDDAIELYKGDAIIETYGDADIDGSGQEWEYTGSWAYKLGSDWITGGVDCSSGSNSTNNSKCIYPTCSYSLVFKGAMEIDTDGGLRIRAYHFEAYSDIQDLSIYRVDIFNNGNPPPAFGTVELPSQSATEGEDILVVRDADIVNVEPYFGDCTHNWTIYESTEVTSNGDDALVFFEGEVPIDTLGVVGVDGTGQVWDYTNSFGFREVAGADFTFPGSGCSNSATSNETADCVYTFCE